MPADWSGARSEMLLTRAFQGPLTSLHYLRIGATIKPIRCNTPRNMRRTRQSEMMCNKMQITRVIITASAYSHLMHMWIWRQLELTRDLSLSLSHTLQPRAKTHRRIYRIITRAIILTCIHTHAFNNSQRALALHTYAMFSPVESLIIVLPDEPSAHFRSACVFLCSIDGKMSCHTCMIYRSACSESARRRPSSITPKMLECGTRCALIRTRAVRRPMSMT